MILYINHRLNEWAEWVFSGNRAGLGYPSQAPFMRLTPASGRDWSPEANERAWEIDRAVRSLENYHIAALRVFYLQSSTMDQKCRDLNMSRDTLYSRIHGAHIKIMDWLNDLYAGLIPDGEKALDSPPTKVVQTC